MTASIIIPPYKETTLKRVIGQRKDGSHRLINVTFKSQLNNLPKTIGQTKDD